MYSLVAYSSFKSETLNFERGRQPTSPKLFRFSSLNLGSWKTGSFRSKSTERSSVGSGSPTISSYRQSNRTSRKSSTIISNSKNSTSTTTSTSSKNSNIITASNKNSNNIIITTTPASSDLQNKYSTVQRKTIYESSHDSSGSSLDEDEDLYEFDIYEDERRYRSILKRSSKYGPLSIPMSPKSRGIWGLFGSSRKPQANGNPSLSTGSVPPVVGSSAGSPKTQRPGTGVPIVSPVVRGCESPIFGSPKDLREDPSSDGGYSSDEGIQGEIDWNHFQLTQSMEKEKKNVYFSDPLVSHVYRHSYKSYIPRDAALVTMRV